MGLVAERLSQLEKPPEHVYHRGANIEKIDLQHSVAIVGSRKVSEEGATAAFAMGRKMAEEGRVVVSGLALGIDSAAFEGCLSGGGVCIAVLPSGVDIVTPPSNQGLADRIMKGGGAMISEWPDGMHPMRHTFILRNRLIAALADTVILGEARPDGGAWHTVRAAWELGRETLRLEHDGGTSSLQDPQRKLF